MHPDKTIKKQVADMDARLLFRKGRCWYVQFTFPRKFNNPKLSGKKIRLSLQTAELKTAQDFRDKYIRPILALNTQVDALKKLIILLGESQSELDVKVLESLDKLNLRGFKPENSITLAELCAQYLDHLRLKTKRKASSIERYRLSLECLLFIIGGDTPAASLNHTRIEAFVSIALKLPRAWSYKRDKMSLEDMLAEKWENTLSHNTVSDYMVLAKQMYSWAIEGDVVRMSMPFKKLGNYLSTTENEHKRPPDHNEADKILKMPCPKRIGSLEWKFIPLIARYSGMRLAEICQLCAEDLIIQDGVLCYSICHNVKTTSSRRIVPVAEKILPEIKRLISGKKTGRLFTQCGDTGSGERTKYGHEFSKHYNVAVKKIHPDLTFHGWRSYANTELARAGVSDIDRERILGHRNERTNAVYLAEEVKRYKKALDKVF